MRKIKLLSMVAVLELSLSACNTVDGVGEDLQTLGRGVEKTVD